MLTEPAAHGAKTGARLPRRRFAAGGGAGALLLTCSLACGCAGPAPGPPDPALSPAALAVLVTSRAAATMEAGLADAVQALIQRCMRAKHLAYYPDSDRGASLGTGGQLPEFPPYTSLAQRRARGYGLYASAVAARGGGRAGAAGGPGAVGREQAYLRSLPVAARAAYLTAEFGRPGPVMTVALPGGARAQVGGGGCRGAAARRIYGSVAGYILALEGAPLLSDELVSKVESDPRFAAAVRAWSRCMAGLGFRYASPGGAYNELDGDYRVSGPVRELRRREIAVASADYGCAQRTGLLRVTAVVQRADASRLSATAEAQLRQITRIDTRAAQRARHVAA